MVFSRLRRLSLRARVITGVSIVAVLVLLVVAVDAGASSPVVCASCHEMQPWVASWSVSPHAEVACYSCHGTPRPWYGAPLSVVERAAMLGRDVGAHGTDRGEEVTGTGNGGAAKAVPDSTCEQCHDPARVGTSRFGVQIKHTEHAARNKSCVSCHRWTAHPDPNGDRNTLMMKECFKCHSLSKGAKAPGTCDTCHLKGLDLRPDSHKTGKWLTSHGKVAIADRQQCSMCHRDDFCRDCHGVVMPHPKGWARGPSSHAVIAKQDRRVCSRCHKGNTDLCTMCHHPGFDPKKGPWVARHSAMASDKGVSFCFECHDALFCASCHSAVPAEGSP
jgi:nitrate/TMAO reductase-like tetraheme cytochrome c subunit